MSGSPGLGSFTKPLDPRMAIADNNLTMVMSSRRIWQEDVGNGRENKYIMLEPPLPLSVSILSSPASSQLFISLDNSASLLPNFICSKNRYQHSKCSPRPPLFSWLLPPALSALSLSPPVFDLPPRPSELSEWSYSRYSTSRLSA